MLREISIQKQLQIKHDAEMQAVQEMTEELERIINVTRTSKDSEIKQLKEKHQQLLEVRDTHCLSLSACFTHAYTHVIIDDQC